MADIKAMKKKVLDYIIESFKPIDPKEFNIKRYTKLINNMNDQEFHQFMLDLKEKKDIISYYAPNMTHGLTVQMVRDQATKLGVQLFERLYLWDEPTNSYYLTVNKYCILMLPIRKVAQYGEHKMSVPEGDNKIDVLSGQVVREDKAGSMSLVEIQTLLARNLEKTSLELLKYRGGDVTAMSEYKRELEETGRTTITRNTGSIPRSAALMDVFYSGMMIETNFSGV